MTIKKSLESRLLEKIASVYLRLIEQRGDEGEARRQLEVFSLRALERLGLADGGAPARAARLAALAVERAQGGQPQAAPLRELRLGGDGPGGYAVGFLPGAGVADTPANRAVWTRFLESLAARTRIGPDPDSGEIGILFRQGTWLADLVLSDDVGNLDIPKDIKRVRGALMAPGARVVARTFTHRLIVDGDLVIHHEMLRQEPPPLRHGGDLRLAGLRGLAGAVFGPERLLAWGLEPGRCLALRGDTFTLDTGDDPAAPAFVLRGENILSSYAWRGETWVQVRQERLPQETFEAVHARLERLALELGLGADFVVKSVSRVPDDAQRLALYLLLALDAAFPGPDVACVIARDPLLDAQAAGARRLVDALLALGALFEARTVDAPAVDGALAAVTEADQTAALALAARPRPRLSEKAAQADLEAVTALLDGQAEPPALAGDGLAMARTLRLALRSPRAQANLEQALAPLTRALDAVVGALRPPDPPGLDALLEHPDRTLHPLRETLRALGRAQTCAPLEAELRELRAMAPRELVRRLAAMPADPGPAGEADRALLRALYQPGHPDAPALEPRALLALALPALRGPAAPRLRQVLAALNTGQPPADPLARLLAQAVAALPPEPLENAEAGSRLLGTLRAWARQTLETVRRYNRLTAEDAAAQREAEREEKERAMIALPPDVARDITGRLDRMCLILGLGRNFIAPGGILLEANLRRLDHYLALALAIVPGAPRPALEQAERDLTESVLRALRALLHSLDTADADDARQALEALTDQRLTALAAVLAKPRLPADVTALKADAAYLDGLRDARLTLDRVFTSPGRLLLFANACLESKELKQAVSTRIKPVYFAVSALGGRAGGVSSEDLLRGAPGTREALERLGVGGAAAKAQAATLAKALEAVQARPVRDLVADLRRSCPPGSGSDQNRDGEFLGRLLALDGTTLGSLQLSGDQTARLLLLHLDSHLAVWVRTRQEAGRFAGRTSRQVVAAALERARWELEILAVYNRLSTRPRGRGGAGA
jgi:hypothetical protein